MAALIALAGPVAPVSAAEAVRIAIHVDENDPARMNMALNNAQNVRSYYEAQGVPVEIEIVTYGPGLDMLIAGKSPVASRVAAMSLEGVTFSACANTMAGIEKRTGEKPKLLDEAQVVPSGVVRLVELQRAGWAYIRP
ncbi:MAG: hypothetical protein D6686_00355 [Alphaproteobacteria bacterium]|nr:MAG: hypothetical protein D6686_00355 [Alphaproteobacteria bacterium]